MGLSSLSAISRESVDVVLKCDDALDMTADAYKAYIDAGAPKELLVYKEGKTPTWFKLRLVLPYRSTLKLENMKLDLIQKRDGDTVTKDLVPQLAWMIEDVRLSLVAIEQPPGEEIPELVYKRDAEGGASFELMSVLMALDVYADLFNARHNAKAKFYDPLKKSS